MKAKVFSYSQRRGGLNLPYVCFGVRNDTYRKSTTLLELLIAITLVSMIIMAFSSIDMFSRYHLLTSEKRAKVQNEISYCLGHMSKQISRAIGDINQPAVEAYADTAVYQIIKVKYDSDGNGKYDATDLKMCYACGMTTGAALVWRYKIRYCSNVRGGVICSSGWEELTNKITNCKFSTSENYLTVKVTGCYDPSAASKPCGTPDNPTVTLTNRIQMPSVSTH